MLKNNHKYIYLGLAILILVSVPFSFAHAGWLIDGIADTVIFLTVGWMFALVEAILAGLIALMGSGVDTMLNMPIQNSGVIESAWNLVRQFTNMFFIVIMVVMAFYTIFDLGGYDFKTLIARFIIAALLINFSLVICGVIIDITQTVSSVFLNAIGSVGDRLAQASEIGERFAAGGAIEAVPIDHTVSQKVIGAFADIILLGIMFFSLTVLFVMTFIRIPILWALMIFAPVAWITYILPSTRNINQQWWKNFIGWNIFFPIYLFFIYIGVFLLSKRTELLSGTNTATFLGINFEDLFFYILIAMILIGGAKMAMSAGMAGGAGGVALGVWGKGKAAAKFAGSRVPVFGGYSARDIGAGIEAKQKQIREEGLSMGGFKVTSGEQGHRERSARIGSMLGVRGMELAQQREFLTKTDREYKDLQEKFDTGKISQADIEAKARAGNASNPIDYAHIKMLAKLGNLDRGTYVKTLTDLENNPMAARDFAQTAKESKFSNIDGKDVVAIATRLDENDNEVHDELKSGKLTPARKEMVRFVQSEEKIRAQLTQRQFKTMVDLLGGPNTAEGKNFIKDVGETRPDLAVEYNFMKNPNTGDYEHGDSRKKTMENYGVDRDIRDPAGNVIGQKSDTQIDGEIKEKHYDGVVTVGAEKLAKMPIEVWNRQEFKEAWVRSLFNLKTLPDPANPALRVRNNQLKTYRDYYHRVLGDLNNVKNPTDRSRKQTIFQNEIVQAVDQMVNNLP